MHGIFLAACLLAGVITTVSVECTHAVSTLRLQDMSTSKLFISRAYESILYQTGTVSRTEHCVQSLRGEVPQVGHPLTRQRWWMIVDVMNTEYVFELGVMLVHRNGTSQYRSKDRRSFIDSNA